MRLPNAVAAVMASVLLLACAESKINPCEGLENCTLIPLGEDVQRLTQEALINAKPGDVIGFEEGVYEFENTLTLSGVADVTIRGVGMDKTILSFAGQKRGNEGLKITADNITLENFAVEDTLGDAIKIEGADGVTIRGMRVEWTRGPHEENGAYGLYPVQCKNVLIEDSVAIAASDAGIYVGQSENIVVRRNRAEFNVAGIEIENSIEADVYENVATNNTGGILIFSLPGLQLKNGRHVRVYDNHSYANNTPNFAPAGNIVGQVPAGTGVMLLSNVEIEVFNNRIEDNGTANVLIVGYLTVDGKIREKDPEFYPYPETIYVHGNTFVGGGDNPDMEQLSVLAILSMLGPDYDEPIPDIVWDGSRNPDHVDETTGQLVEAANICIQDNGGATFVDLNDFSTPFLFDLTPHDCSHPPLSAATIPQLQ